MLEMLEVKDDMRFGRLDDDSAKVKWMWRVYPRVDWRSQAPWTIVMLVTKPSQSIHTSRETYTRFAGGPACRVSFRGLLSLLATQ